MPPINLSIHRKASLTPFTPCKHWEVEFRRELQWVGETEAGVIRVEESSEGVQWERECYKYWPVKILSSCCKEGAYIRMTWACNIDAMTHVMHIISLTMALFSFNVWINPVSNCAAYIIRNVMIAWFLQHCFICRLTFTKQKKIHHPLFLGKPGRKLHHTLSLEKVEACQM